MGLLCCCIKQERAASADQNPHESGLSQSAGSGTMQTPNHRSQMVVGLVKPTDLPLLKGSFSSRLMPAGSHRKLPETERRLILSAVDSVNFIPSRRPNVIHPAANCTRIIRSLKMLATNPADSSSEMKGVRSPNTVDSELYSQQSPPAKAAKSFQAYCSKLGVSDCEVFVGPERMRRLTGYRGSISSVIAQDPSLILSSRTRMTKKQDETKLETCHHILNKNVERSKSSGPRVNKLSNSSGFQRSDISHLSPTHTFINDGSGNSVGEKSTCQGLSQESEISKVKKPSRFKTSKNKLSTSKNLKHATDGNLVISENFEFDNKNLSIGLISHTSPSLGLVLKLQTEQSNPDQEKVSKLFEQIGENFSSRTKRSKSSNQKLAQNPSPSFQIDLKPTVDCGRAMVVEPQSQVLRQEQQAARDSKLLVARAFGGLEELSFASINEDDDRRYEFSLDSAKQRARLTQT
jgi:hypothetical protein